MCLKHIAYISFVFFFFQAEDGIRDIGVTGVQTCALPIYRVKAVMEKLGLPHGEPITHSMINKAIENAQTKIESRNFGIRKNWLEFDDVMNKQRTAIYASRKIGRAPCRERV